MKAVTKTVTLTIDEQSVTVDSNLTILAAARQAEIVIPTLCHHPALSDWGGCRLCVVQVDQSPKLMASCVTPVRDGMEVITDNSAIAYSRRQTLELLLVERNHYCMFCPSSGECELQQMAYALKLDHLTVPQSFDQFPVDASNRYVCLDHNRCILCGRCVRACEEIAGCHVLGFHNRGTKTLIGFDLLSPRNESGCIHCGVCLQVCPTGALSNRLRTHSSVHGQSTNKKEIASVCVQCSLLCPTFNTVRANQLLKVEGVLSASSASPERGQLCHLGRFEVLKDSPRRLLSPMIKDEQGCWHACSWQDAIQHGIENLRELSSRQGSHSLFGMISGNASNETLYLFKELMGTRWTAGYMDTLDGSHYRSLMKAEGRADQTLFLENSWRKIIQADMVLAIGTDFNNSHPLFLSILRRLCMENKICVAAINQDSKDNFFCTHHLFINDTELQAVLKYLEDIHSNRTKLQHPPIIFKEDRQNTLKEIARSLVTASNPMIISDIGFTSQPEGLVKLIKLKNSGKKYRDSETTVILLPPACNSMAAWRLGLAAQKSAQNIGIGGIMLLAREKEPAVAPWQSGQTAPAFLVTITPYLYEEVAELTHVMLPNALWLEEDGTFGGLNGTEKIFKPKIIDPPTGVKPSWEILHLLDAGANAVPTRLSFSQIRERSAKFLNAGIA